jgi:hypothetical protein
LLSGSRVKGIDFEIHKAASISGRILDPDRNPVQGALVALYKQHFGRTPYLETRDAVVSDASGNYLFSGVRGGTYYLSAAPSNLNRHLGRPSGRRQPELAPVQTYYPDSTSRDNAAPVYLNRAEQREGVDLVMNQTLTYCVTGKLSLESENIPVLAGLRVSYVDGGAFAMGNPQPGEEFEICGLPPGSFDLWISTERGDRITGFIGTAFTVANRDVAVGELYPERPVPLRGKVIVADAPADRSLPVVSVTVRSLNRRQLHFAGEGIFGLSNSKGELLIPNLLADEYELVAVQRLQQGFYVKSVTQAGRDVTHDSIRPGDDVMITLASDGPAINGETVDKDSQPVHDATVILIPKDHGSVRSYPYALARMANFSSIPGSLPVITRS